MTGIANPTEQTVMEIKFTCPTCGKLYIKDFSVAGKRARCKECGSEFVVPNVSQSQPTSTSPSPNRPQPRKSEPAPPIASFGADSPNLIPPLDSEVVPPVTARPTPVRPAQPSPIIRRGPEETLRSERFANTFPESKPGLLNNPSLIPFLLGAGAASLVYSLGLLVFFAFRGPATPSIEAGGDLLNEAQVEAPNSANSVSGPAMEAPAELPSVASTEPPIEPTPIPRASDNRPAQTFAQQLARWEPSVALIKGKRGSGTGFIVGPGILATNAHVIDGETIENVEIRFPSADHGNQGPMNARLLYQDKVRDIAFLAIDSKLPSLPITESFVRKGEDVTVVGNPGIGENIVLENVITRGVVGSMTRLNGRELMQLSISINPGNSGGPVLNAEGEVIGVVTLKATRQQGLAFCVPAKELNAALSVAKGRANNTGAGNLASNDAPASSPASNSGSVPNTPAGNAPELSYGWSTGQTYVYGVHVAIDAGDATVNLEGSSIYRVKSVDDQVITLGHKGWLVTRRRGKDGKVVGGGLTGPTGGDQEIELRIDRKGNVIDAKGSSPLPLLGDLSLLVIEPFPDDPQLAWEDAKTISLNEVQQAPGGGGTRLGRPDVGSLPRGGIQSRLGTRGGIGARGRLSGRPSTQPAPQPTTTVIAHPAQEQTDYKVGSVDPDGKVQIVKKYELVTDEIVSEEPRLKMTGDGNTSFDAKNGIPLSIYFKAKLVETTSNITIRLPITVNCKLLTGEEAKRASRPILAPPTLMNPLEPKELVKILSDLKASDINVRKTACRILFEAAPIQDKKSEVARALERQLDDNDRSLRGELVRTLGLWGDGTTVMELAERLKNESYGTREELFEAVGRLEPSLAGVEAVIPWLVKERDRAVRSLKAVGPIAEDSLVKILTESDDTKLKVEICRVLRDIGGSKSVDVLKSIAALKTEVEIGRAANDVINGLSRRYPKEEEWTTLFHDLKSPDANRRRGAADRIANASPVQERRTQVARGLDELAGDGDQNVRNSALRAMAIWGDGQSGTLLLSKCADPKFQVNYEAVNAITQILLDDPRVPEALAPRYKTGDRRIIGESLRSMGSMAEKPLITVLKSEQDNGICNEIINILSVIGTDPSSRALVPFTQHKDGGVRGTSERALEQIRARLNLQAPKMAVAELKSPDRNRVKQAVERLATSKPADKRPPDIARALDDLIDDKDVFMRDALMRALANWGDNKTGDAILAKLDAKDGQDWKPLLTALCKLRVDDRVTAAAIQRCAEDWRFVSQQLKSHGPTVEMAFVDFITSDADTNTRMEACHALGEFASPAVVPSLTKLASSVGNEQLANEAAEALKAAAARSY